jgi:hypothetical protein
LQFEIRILRFVIGVKTHFFPSNRKPGNLLRPLFSYTGIVPESRVCVVSFTDAEGITHSVEVAAASLFEAAVRGLAAFSRPELGAGIPVGPGFGQRVIQAGEHG